MQYFLGSIITLIVLFVLTRIYKDKTDEPIMSSIAYSQSSVHEILKPVLPTNKALKAMKPLISQAQKYYDEQFTRVILVENMAYWIKDNAFYSAETDNGTILQETAKTVDTIAMDKVQLDKMIFIVEKLTEGLTDDRGNTGQSKF
jgi:hypothetical protein